MRKLFFVLLIVSLSFFAKATHQYGSDITWTCVGQDSFLVKYTYYRDCNGIQGSTNTLNIRDHSTNTLIRSESLAFSSTVDITPICSSIDSRCNGNSTFPYGIEKKIALKVVYLGNVGSICEIRFENYGDSRVGTSNLSSGGVGVFVYSVLNRCLSPCDNSPQLMNDPILLGCIGTDFHYNIGANDQDRDSIGNLSDSISYELNQPRNSYGTTISYSGSYSYDKPLYFWGFPNANATLPHGTGFRLNKQTGDIEFRPMKIESTFLMLKVIEWRKISGVYVKIGEVNRDIAFQVISCPQNNKPRFSNLNTLRICAGNNLVLPVLYTDTDFHDTVQYKLIQKPAGSTWSDNNLTTRKASGTLYWQTDSSDISVNPYTLTLQIYDNKCPAYGQSSKSYLIYVEPSPKAEIEILHVGINKYELKAINTKSVISYKLYVNNKHVKSNADYFLIINSIGSYPIRLEVEGSGCTKAYFDTLEILKKIKVELPNDTVICKNGSISITPIVSDSLSHVSYIWSTGDSTSFLQLNSLVKDTLVILEVRDSMFSDTDSMWIKVDDFNISLSQDTITCPGNPVELSATPQFDEGHIISSFNWLDLSCTCPKGHTESIIVYMPGTFSCEAINENGCKDKDTIIVFYDKEPKINFLPIPDICLNDENLALDSFVSPKGGIWYGQDTILVKNNVLRVNKADAKSYLLFYSYTDTATHCFTFDKTTVAIKDYPKINIIQAFSFCDEDEYLDLEPYVSPDGGIWSGSTGIGFDHFFNPSKSNSTNPLVYKVSDSNGCANSKEIYFNLNPLPIVDFVADKDTGTLPLQVQFINQSSISSGIITNYLWYFGDGDSSFFEHPSHTYLNQGLLDVKLIAISDSTCIGELTKEQLIEVFSSLHENHEQFVTIYPNPVSDKLFIDVGKITNCQSISIFNTVGMKVLSDNNAKLPCTIDVIGLKQGIYFLQLDLNEFQLSRRILIE
ncbi:MAG: T9SS type A sorting domain-containing protein [Bacteroidetes bacterium]|nr:T9SS type A sorting domain-containing protein [Bacteroidota bacterium]